MGGAKKFLFGSKPETKIHDPYRAESEYEKSARERITAGTSGLYGQGTGLMGSSADRFNQMAQEYDPDAMLQKQSGIVNDWTANQTGGLLNNLAGRGIVNSSVAQNALGDIGNQANNMLLGMYNNNVDRSARLNAQSYDMGQGLIQPYQDLYRGWQGFRAATPQSVTQTQGSGGLLGGVLGGVGSTFGNTLGKKWGLG